MSDAPSATQADFWHVQLASGQVRYLSLEELDEAFQRDEVDAKTYVLKEGDTTWQRLGELLGLDEVCADLVAVPVAPYSIPPSIPPSSVRASEAPGALSIRPVVSDLADMDDDELVASMKPKRKNVAAISGGAFAALLVAVVGITHASVGSDDKAAAAAAPVAVAAMVAPPVAPVDDTAGRTTLSDDVKRSLLEADKAREAKAAAKAAENAKFRSTMYVNHGPKSGPVFHKGGSQYDPLNSGN